MDKSRTYIKMCEKAEEIQKTADTWWDSFSYSFWQGGMEHTIWLPRQDQLQEMVFQIGQYGSRQIVKALWDACKDDGSLVPREELGIPRIGTVDKRWSMEQLWLAFVMKEKYDKVWNGEEWIDGRGT